MILTTVSFVFKNIYIRGINTKETIDDEERVTSFEHLWGFYGLRNIATVIMSLGVEIRQFFERISTLWKFIVAGNEVILLFVLDEVMSWDGRYADIVECIDGIDLQFELLKGAVIIFFMVMGILVGIGDISFDPFRRSAMHPFYN